MNQNIRKRKEIDREVELKKDEDSSVENSKLNYFLRKCFILIHTDLHIVPDDK